MQILMFFIHKNLLQDGCSVVTLIFFKGICRMSEQEKPNQKSLNKMMKSATEASVVFEDDRTKITVGPGYVQQTNKPKKYKKFTIFINSIEFVESVEQREKNRDKTESKLGFNFGQAIPVHENEGSSDYFGYEFEERPDLETILPDGWTLGSEGNMGRIVSDSQDRFRGRISVNEETNACYINFWPCFKFDNDIVVNRRSDEYLGTVGEGESLRHSFSLQSRPYFMPALKTPSKDILPFFIYAHFYMWSEASEEHDFSRLSKEYKKIDLAKKFIAKTIHEILPATSLKTGTDQSVIRYGGEAMLWENQVPGDVFAYWDEEGIDGRVNEIKEIAACNLPEILGDDNSLILKILPTEEDIKGFKLSPPDYTPPAPKKWQAQLYKFDRWIGRLKGNNQGSPDTSSRLLIK